MTGGKPEDEDLTKMLGQTAKAQAEAADRAAQNGGAEPSAPDSFRPLDDAERAALTQVLFGAEVVPLSTAPRMRRKWIAGAAAIVAAAAAIAIAFFSQLTSTQLPHYRMSVESGAREVRAPSEPRAQKYQPGSRLELVFQPEQPIEIQAPVRVLIAKTGEAAKALEVPIEYSAGGAIRIRGFVGRDFLLPEGDSTLIVVIGSDDAAQKFEYALSFERGVP